MAAPDRTKQLMQAQINERRELASKLDTGGPKAKARAQALRDEADRLERKVLSDFPRNNPPSWHMRHAR